MKRVVHSLAHRLITFTAYLFSRLQPRLAWKNWLRFLNDQGIRFAHYEKEQFTEFTFSLDDERMIRFRANLEDGVLHYASSLTFGEYALDTDYVLKLSAHLNTLISWGVIRVYADRGVIEYHYRTRSSEYALYPERIEGDFFRMYGMAQDLLWTMQEMSKTGDDPLFVVAELMRRREKITPQS